MMGILKPLWQAACLLLATACANAGVPGPPLDRSRLVPTFVEDFDAPLSVWNARLNPTGRWKTNYFFSIQDTAQPHSWESRTLEPNKELQYYGDPLDGTGSFEWKKGELAIVARANPFVADPRTGRLPYLSGLLTTEATFAQTYGYFEARIAMPAGKGLWPAFWLLPKPVMKDGWAKSVGEQEIDIVENIGDPHTLFLTVHHDDNGRKVKDLEERRVDIDLTGFHTYGLMLTREDVVWYIDDHEVRRRPNTDFHMPAYMLLNLAVGGEWPGAPDATTPLPARMKLAWVRAYRLK